MSEASTHRVEVVQVKLHPHPNADKLAIVEVYGYQCVVGKDDWKDGDLAAYIVPDSVVDTARPEFAFLGKNSRIRVKKLRGIMSQGLLVKAPPDSKQGDDVAALLGVTRYEPPMQWESGGRGAKITGGEAAPGPAGVYPKYDVESWHRYKHLLETGEPVIITEKLHGASARYVFDGETFHCGSRSEWKRQFACYDHVTVESLAPKVGEEKAMEIIDRLKSKPPKENLWWVAAKACPAIEAFCRHFPGMAVYGEVYGQVQDLKYGTKPGEVRFAAFDLLWNGRWVPGTGVDEMIDDKLLPWVPVLFVGPYSESLARELAAGPSTIDGAKHVREGIVIRPIEERTCPEIGRVQLKLVSDQYLERAA